MRDRDPSSHELLPGALARYVAGESDRSECERVEGWAAASAERRAYLAALLRTWARARAGATSAELRETDAAWAALRGRLGEAETSLDAVAIEVQTSPAKSGGSFAGTARGGGHRRGFVIPALSRSPWSLPRAAAAALLLAGGVGVLRHFYFQPPESTARVAVAPAPMREVVTGIGERARIRLGDGSRIVLGARSRIGIPTDFGVNSREIEAEGEAYFEVAHDSTLPFIVHARGARALDLGTAFVVRAYPEETEVRVVVTEGAVTFGADSSLDPRSVTTTLRRGEMGRLAAGAISPVIRAVNPDHYTDWIDGRLSFDDTPLSEVIAELGRWHRTQILLADSTLARETLTATLTADSFRDALQTLTTVLVLRAERKGGSVILHRRARRS